MFEEALNLGNIEVIDALFSRSSVDHSTHDQVPGPLGVRNYFVEVCAGFPDMHVIIDDLIATDNKVVVRTWNNRGRCDCPFGQLAHCPSLNGKKATLVESKPILHARLTCSDYLGKA